MNREFGKYDDAVFEKLKKSFSELINDSVKLRLRSDVPVGTCLSGGLDSSTVVTIISKILTAGGNNNQKQKTFSAVYDDASIDERNFIEEIVKQTGSDSKYVFPDKADFLNDADDFLFQLDEPFGGTSPYAQWNVMKLARENNVTVLLDGQGADESLGGYEVYFGFVYSNFGNFLLFDF